MKDTDYAAASMRVHSLERHSLTADRLERMLSAPDSVAALQILPECGYAPVTEATAAALEQALADGRAKAFALMNELLPGSVLAAVFQVKYDYHNLKVVVKGAGKEGLSLLLPLGRMEPDTLREAYAEGRWKLMPGDMGEAALKAKETLQGTSDPQRTDFMLDKACYGELSKLAAGSKDAFLINYVALLADSANLRTIVRWLRQGREAALMGEALLPGGTVKQADLLALPADGEGLSALFSKTLEQAAGVGQAALADRSQTLRELERQTDNSVTSYLRQAKLIPFGSAPLIAYFAAREAELAALRTALGGRLAGVDPATLRERLRECYG